MESWMKRPTTRTPRRHCTVQFSRRPKHLKLTKTKSWSRGNRTPVSNGTWNVPSTLGLSFTFCPSLFLIRELYWPVSSQRMASTYVLVFSIVSSQFAVVLYTLRPLATFSCATSIEKSLVRLSIRLYHLKCWKIKCSDFQWTTTSGRPTYWQFITKPPPGCAALCRRWGDSYKVFLQSHLSRMLPHSIPESAIFCGSHG